MEFKLRQPPPVTKLVATALCYGIRPSEAATHALTVGIDDSFIHGTPLVLDSGRVINTAMSGSLTLRPTAVPLDHDGSSFFLEYEGRRFRCAPVVQPAVLTAPSGYGAPWSDFVKLHSPKTIFATPLRECVFGATGSICQFCTFEGRHLAPVPPEQLADVVAEVARSISGSVGFALGSGTPNLNDHGVRYFSRIAREVTARIQCGISVELVPPHDLRDLEMMRASGVQSLVMSIEVWDVARRKAVCPGKSYVSRRHYLDAWTRAVEVFGRGNVSSVLLAGLDAPASIEEAIREMVAIGVVPTLIPFRPYDGTPLANHPPTQIEPYLRLAGFNAAELLKARLTPYLQRGCTECQGCSIDAPEDWKVLDLERA